jgi:DNA-directed RNA polymerase subunit M/transcription elongation factor TFIIS
MNLLQRVFTWLLGPGVERESREWRYECGHCGHRESVWESGGIRYRASGEKSYISRCPSCGRKGKRWLRRSP